MDARSWRLEGDIRALTLAFTAGVLLQHALPQVLPLGVLLGFLLLALPRWPGRVLLLGFTCGAALASLHAQSQLDARWPDARHHEEHWIRGQIVSLPERGAGIDQGLGTWRFSFAPDDAAAYPSRIRVSWYRSEHQPRGGECWKLRLRLRAPQGSLNPGGFDYENWLHRQHFGATASVREAERCEAEQAMPILRLRQAWSERVDAVLGERAGAALLKALTIGDDSALRDADWRVFRTTGTTHLVAISGFNLAVVAACAFFMLRWLWASLPRVCLWLPAQRFAAFGTAAVATFYALLAGFEPPIARALFMLLVMLLVATLDRFHSPSRVLAWAFLPIVAVDPCAVLAPGLWLSFGAVAAIFYLLASRRGAEPAWRAALRVQLMLSAVLAPLTLAYFHGLSWAAPLVNLLAVPAFAALTPVLSVAAIVAAASSTLAAWLLPSLASALEWLLQALAWIAVHWPAAWWAAAPPSGALALALLGALLLFAPRGLPLRRLGLLCCVPLAMPVSVPVRGGLELQVLDVGQGLAVLVETARHRLLFDAGPAYAEGFDAGAAVVVPAVLKRGARHLDTLVLSHADNDHAGGVAAVREALRIDREIGTAHGEPCRDGQHWEWDGVRFTILHPDVAGDGSDNDASCVLRIDGPYSVLLPGDIERRAEARLLDRHRQALRADVLLAPHHGSRSSSTADFVAAVRPQWVIFASGWRNRFRHPRPEVVARYRDCGARMLMSGDSGAIRIFGDAQGLQVQRWREVHRRFWNTAPQDLPYWRREAEAVPVGDCGDE